MERIEGEIGFAGARPPPRGRPPTASTSCQADRPLLFVWSGFLKVEPEVFSRMGWVAARFSLIASMRSRMAAGASLRPSNTASVKIQSSGGRAMAIGMAQLVRFHDQAATPRSSAMASTSTSFVSLP